MSSGRNATPSGKSMREILARASDGDTPCELAADAG